MASVAIQTAQEKIAVLTVAEALVEHVHLAGTAIQALV